MAIPTYVKNVAKSFGYSIADTIKDYNPVVDSLLSDTKSATEDLFSSIGSFRDDLMSGSEKTLKEELKDTTRDIWENFKDDVKSGNLYRRDKKNPLATIAMQAAGFDMADFDFDMDDWGDDDWNADDSQKAEVEQSVKNTTATITAIDVASERIVTDITSVQAQSTEYLAHVTRSGNRAIYDLNKRGFNNVSRALLGVNKSISTLVQLGKPLTEHMQNSVTFFTKTTESLEAIKTSLANIEKNTAVSMPNDKSSNRKMNFSDIFSEDSGLSISSYVDMVKQNFGDNKWMVDALVSGVKNLKNARSSGSLGKNISITTIAMQMITKALFPQALAQAMKGFNESLKAFTGAALVKFRDKSTDNFLLSMLKDMFAPSNEVAKLKTGSYEKGRIAWDGIAKKALTDVIPGYLRMIYSAISGEDRVYDYNRGQFRSMSEVNSDFRKMQTNRARNAGGDFRKEAIKKMAAARGISDIKDKANSSEMAAIEADIDKFFIAAMYGSDAQRSGYHNFKDIDKLAKLMGVPREVIEAMVAVNSEAKGSSRNGDKATRRGIGNRMITSVESARNSYNDEIARINESGVSAYFNKVNGSTRKGGMMSSQISLGEVIPSYLAMLLANQQIQLGAMGFKEGIYRYYNYRSGRWEKDYYKAIAAGTTNVRKTRQREGRTQGSSGGNNRSDSSGDEEGPSGNWWTEYDDEKTAEELAQEEKEQQKKFKDEVGKTKLGRALKKGHDFLKERLKGTKNVPGVIGSVARMFDSVTYSIDTMFFGHDKDDPNSISNVFKTELQKVFEPLKDFYNKYLKEHFDKFASWLDEKFPGLAGVKEKLKEWKTNAGNWIHNKIFGTDSLAYRKREGERASAAQTERLARLQEENPEAFEQVMYRAKGGYIPRTGLAVLSRGELVIPSEYNPFYNGPTNKASQIAAEKRIASRYFGNYAEGGTAGEGKGGLVGLGVEGFKQLLGFFSSFGGGNKGDKKNDDEQKTIASKIKAITGAAFGGDNSKDNIASMAAGGIVGAGVSLLTGAVVGPLFGAAIGAGVGLVANSKEVQKVLFGEDVVNEETGKKEKSGGILGKKVSTFMANQLPDIGKGAGVGAAAGLFLGSPILGAVVGSTIGFVKSSDKAKEFLFGKTDKDGNYKEGLIPKKIQDKIKQGLPRAIIGAGLMAVAGPFGLLPNLLTGAGLGFLTTSETFREKLVGKDGDEKSQEGSILGLFKTKIIDNLQEIIMNIGNAVKGFFQKALINIGETVKSWTKNFLDKAKKGEGGFLSRAFGKVLNAGEKVARGVIGVPGAMLSSYNRHRKSKNLKNGYNVYDKSLGRNMTAAERLRERNRLQLSKSQAGDYEFDEFLTSLKTQEEFDALTTALANGDESYKGFDLSKYNKGQRRNLQDLVNTEKSNFDPETAKFNEDVKYHVTVVDKLESIYNFLIGKRTPEITAAEANGEAGVPGFAAPKEGDTKTEFTAFGKPMKYKYVSGEWVIDNTDKETDESAKESSKLMESINKIPVLGTAFGGVTAAINGIKTGLFGDGSDKKPGLLNKLHDKLFGGKDGEGGFLSSIFSFFTGEKTASVKTILSKVASGAKSFALDAGIFALIYLGLSGKLDNIFHKLTGGSMGEEKNEHKTTATTEDGTTVYKDEKTGQWVDGSGNVVDASEIASGTVSTIRSDVDSGSTRLKKNLLRGTLTGTGSIVTHLAGRTGLGKAITGSKVISRISNAYAHGGTDAAVTAMTRVAKSGVTSICSSIANGLKKVPILNKVLDGDSIDNMMATLAEKISSKMTGETAKKFANIASSALAVLKVALIVADFTTGYEDARTTLGIVQEPSFGQRLLSGCLRVVKNLIPLVGSFIPDSLLVDVFCDYIAPALHIEPEELKNQRAETDEIIEKYNAEHGTDYTTEQFIKGVMKDYTWTERIGNAAKSTWEDTKVKASKISASIKEKGLIGAAKEGISNIAGGVIDAYNQAGGGISGILAGINGGMAKMLPGVLGQIAQKKVEISAFAKEGKLKDMWNVSLTDKGGEKIEGTDLETATPSLFSRLLGQIPLFFHKIISTPLAIGNSIGNAIVGTVKGLVDDIKKNDEVYNANEEKLDEIAKKGSITEIWKTDLAAATEGGSILSGIYKFAGFISKLTHSVSAIFHAIGNKIGDLINWVTDKFQWAADAKNWIEDKTNNIKETASNTWNGIKEGASNVWNGITGFFSGGSSGFVSQLDPRYANMKTGGLPTADNGCAPAVASMIANAYGQKYSMSSASSDAGRYQNGGGTTLDYFSDSLGSRGINVNNIPSGSGIYSSLQQGNPVILLGQDAGNGSKMRSPFGPNNHYVMATGINRSGNIIINDPEATGPKAYSPSILRGVKAALGTSGGRGSRLRRFAGAGSRMTSKIRNMLRRYYGSGSDDRATIYAFLKNKGLSDIGVSGIMGCWQNESGNRPDRIEGDYMKSYPGFDAVMQNNDTLDNYTLNVLFPAYKISINKSAYVGSDGHYYPGFGLAQWTGPRAYKLLKFAEEKGMDWRSLEAQLEYAWYELSNNYSSVVTALNSATSLEKSTEIAFTKYEGCSMKKTEWYQKRVASAYEIYNAYSGQNLTFNGFSSDQTSSGASAFSTTVASAGSLAALAASAVSNSSGLNKISGVFNAILGGLFGGNLASSMSGATSTTGTTGYSSASTANNGADIYNAFPYYNQGDNPWGPTVYSSTGNSSQTIKNSGCGPTSMAMVMKSYGINVDPGYTSNWSLQNGYRTANSGTSWGFFPAIGAQNGLTVNNFTGNSKAKNYLSKNIPVIASMGPGDFTKGGHYVVLSGYDSATNSITVNDPASRERSSKTWPADNSLSQAKQFWAVSKDGVGSLGTYGNTKLTGAVSDRSTGNMISASGSGIYDTRAGGALRRWRRSNIGGGGAGLATTSTGTTNTGSFNSSNIDAILKKATAQGGNALSPAIVYELLAAIAQILMTIAGNTGSSAQIATLLANYLPKLQAATGMSADQLKTEIEKAKVDVEILKKTSKSAHPENPNLNDVQPSTRLLQGTMLEIATT